MCFGSGWESDQHGVLKEIMVDGDEVQRFVSVQHETFGQEFFYVFT